MFSQLHPAGWCGVCASLGRAAAGSAWTEDNHRHALGSAERGLRAACVDHGHAGWFVNIAMHQYESYAIVI